MRPLRGRKGAGPRERAPLRGGAAWSRRHAAGAAERARGGGSAATLVQRFLAERFLAARAIPGGFFGAPDAGGAINRTTAARGLRGPQPRRLRAHTRLTAAGQVIGHRLSRRAAAEGHGDRRAVQVLPRGRLCLARVAVRRRRGQRRHTRLIPAAVGPARRHVTRQHVAR